MDWAQKQIDELKKMAEKHEKRIADDKLNLENIKKFTGGKKIVFTVNTRYDEISDEYWIGKTGTCISRENVSPNALRSGNTKPRYYINSNCDPIPGNMNQNIVRHFGWRGTTREISVYAHGVRMVEKIVHFKNHARITLSKYHPFYVD